MSFADSIKEIAKACDTEVAAVHERTPNFTDNDGNVTEFFASENQVNAIVSEAVNAKFDGFRALVIEEVRAAMKEGPKAPNVIPAKKVKVPA